MTINQPAGAAVHSWQTLFDNAQQDRETLKQKNCPYGRDHSKTGVRKHFPSDAGAGYRDFIKLTPDLHAVVNDFEPLQDTTYSLAGEDVFLAHFQISGSSYSEFSRNQSIELQGAQCVMLYQPADIIEKEFFPAGAREQSITIACKRRFLSEFFELEDTYIPLLLRELASGRSSRFFVEVSPILPSMCDILRRLMQLESQGRLRHLHIESLTMELLCELFSYHQKLTRRESHADLSSRDAKKIHRAHDYLIECFPRVPSLSEISRHVGLNRNKLCQGFRYIFDQTIGEYCQSQRMQTAGDMLRRSNSLIGDISLLVGYENIASFSSAFRRYYGKSPSEFRE